MLGYTLRRSFHRLPLGGYPHKPTHNEAGFTLLEVLVVTLILGILAAIAAPSWSAYLASQRTRTTNEEAFVAIRKAQSDAIKNRSRYRATFRETTVDGEARVQAFTHAVPDSFSYDTSTLNWENLTEFVLLDTTNTTLASYATTSGDTLYYVEFDFQGNVATVPLGRIVFESDISSDQKSCTFISTLIGGLRVASDEDCS